MPTTPYKSTHTTSAIAANKGAICHLYIYGDIVGRQVPSPGSAGAVSLTSIKDAYASNSTCDELVVHIHSNGGSVYEGFAIYDFLINTRKKITTIVEGLCCSIATVIFMAGTERKLTENSRFLIHNPWANAEGDAARFMDIATELQQEQQRLLNFYRNQTGADTRLLQTYMNTEKMMNPQLALKLGFATGIIDGVKAFALYSNALHNPYKGSGRNNGRGSGSSSGSSGSSSSRNSGRGSSSGSGSGRIIGNGSGRAQINRNQTNNITRFKSTINMDKNKKNRFNLLIAGLKDLVRDMRDDGQVYAAAKTLADDSGDLYFDGELTEGTAVYTDQAMTLPAADGDYEFDDGTTITVDDGLVTEVLQNSEVTSTNDDPQDRQTSAALRKKLVALKAEKAELEKALSESETVMARAQKALQLARSTYRPEKRDSLFNKASRQGNDTDFADKLAAKRQEIKERRSKK